MKTIFAAIGTLAILQTAAATEIAVVYSDDFAEELSDNYGEREGETLTEEIIKDLDRAFAKVGADPVRVDVTIVDAKPNRPTFEQLSSRPGLDAIRSISLGGMELVGTVYDAEGNVVATQEYSWFENNLSNVVGAGVWSDANRASSRFAKKMAKQVSDS